jgi:CPA2 family monovalent cation:H+ antiporter-2
MLLVICFGLAFISARFGLSTALGAFIAGIIMSFLKETHWVMKSLEPFKVIFIALFFASVRSS